MDERFTRYGTGLQHEVRGAKGNLAVLFASRRPHPSKSVSPTSEQTGRVSTNASVDREADEREIKPRTPDLPKPPNATVPAGGFERLAHPVQSGEVRGGGCDGRCGGFGVGFPYMGV